LRDVGYQSAWIIGAVCPARDSGVALVMTRLDTAAMNLFLAELGQAVAPGAHGIVLMDKAGWHTAGDLVVPENLSLVFLPPYSPELTWGDQDQGNSCSRLHDFVLRRVYQIRDPSHST
jgi:hypothetical protein